MDRKEKVDFLGVMPPKYFTGMDLVFFQLISRKCTCMVVPNYISTILTGNF